MIIKFYNFEIISYLCKLLEEHLEVKIDLVLYLSESKPLLPQKSWQNIPNQSE